MTMWLETLSNSVKGPFLFLSKRGFVIMSTPKCHMLSRKPYCVTIWQTSLGVQFPSQGKLLGLSLVHRWVRSLKVFTDLNLIQTKGLKFLTHSPQRTTIMKNWNGIIQYIQQPHACGTASVWNIPLESTCLFLSGDPLYLPWYWLEEVCLVVRKLFR